MLTMASDVYGWTIIMARLLSLYKALLLVLGKSVLLGLHRYLERTTTKKRTDSVFVATIE